MIPGLLRYENDIALHEEVVLMTTKGEFNDSYTVPTGSNGAFQARPSHLLLHK